MSDHEILERLLQQMQELRNDVTCIKLELENRVDPQLQALADGQQTILDTLAPKNRVDALEEEVGFMKTVIRSMAQQLDALQKAR